MSITERYQIPRTGTAEFRARVEDWSGSTLIAADITSVEAVAYEVNSNNGSLTELDSQTLTPSDVLHALAAWDDDATGYNFSHVYPNRAAVFTALKKLYRVEYRLTPVDADQQVIVVAFEFTMV